MNVRIHFEDFPKVCRFCLSFENLHSIFSVDILDLFSKITGIEVKEDDKLPENICNKCTEQLEHIASFIKTCKYNDEFLKSILKELENFQFQDDDVYGDNDIKCESDIEEYYNEDLSKNLNILQSKDINSKKKDDYLNLSSNKPLGDYFISKNNECDSDTKHSEVKPTINDLQLEEHKTKKQKRIYKDDRLKNVKFSCIQCGKSYKQKKRLDSHLKSHNEKKHLENVTSDVKLAKDLIENVKVEILTEPDVEDLNLDKERLIKCEQCGSHFISQLFLESHYADCQSKDISQPKQEIPNIIDYLDVSKVNKVKEDPDEEPEYIKGRKLKGKRRFLCNYCGKNYTRKNGLDRHILSHTGVKPFQCKECGKCYTTKDTLKTHFLTHTGLKAYKCEVCQKSFTQSSHLSYHMRRHAGEKPHVCSFCNKAFLSSYHLERHKLMHTGVKPFECNLCGKHFVRNTTLRDHLLIHTGEKPFQCQHCGKQFNRKQSLTNHMLMHNPTQNSGSYLGPNVYREINIPDVSHIQSISN